MSRVVVIVEGFDNVGKTTVAKALADQLGFEYHAPFGPRADYYDCLMNELTREGPPAIFDRFYFSELVYSKVLPRRTSLTMHQQEVVESMIRMVDPIIIYCTRANEAIEGTWVDREQKYPELVNRVEEFTSEYDLCFKHYQPYYQIMRLPFAHNFSCNPHIFTVRAMAKYTYGRGNCTDPKYFIMGEIFANNNKWKVPFERSDSGQMIHTALREVGVNLLDCWFTNAIKKGRALDNVNRDMFRKEVDYLGPSLCLTFGRTARFLCEISGRPFINFTHPGFYLRKGRPELFFEEFTQKWGTRHY